VKATKLKEMIEVLKQAKALADKEAAAQKVINEDEAK
jgi:hypothetical protein